VGVITNTTKTSDVAQALEHGGGDSKEKTATPGKDKVLKNWGERLDRRKLKAISGSWIAMGRSRQKNGVIEKNGNREAGKFVPQGPGWGLPTSVGFR